jgi:phosphatidylserine decarboxylase
MPGEKRREEGDILNRGAWRIPIAKEGLVFIIPSLAVSLSLWGLGFFSLAAIFSLGTAFMVYFFRDPERSAPNTEKAVLSPADGTVIQLLSCQEDRFLKGPAIKIGIFMSLFNVHVNRIPLTGRIIGRSYSAGRFFCANLDKASSQNEQIALIVETPERVHLVVVQIAGMIARRIVCRVNPGDPVIRGERFGLIRFGSRLDVYLPPSVRVQVQLGQKVLG